jgi:hypothetical protein
LVVEDESVVAMDVEGRLKKLGYTVADIALSGEEAVQKAAELRPDLVLMDIVLKGGIDGVEAAEQIRTQFDIPVIYVTAYTDDPTLERAKFTEPFGYILKPFEERELHTTIQMTLYKHRMERRLKESQQWLATMLQSVGDAVIATDTDGRITLMNPVAEALLGCVQEEVSGSNLTDVFKTLHEDTREPTEGLMDLAIRHGSVVRSSRHLLITPVVTEAPIDETAAPIKNDQGDILGVVLVFRDITELRERQAQLTRAERLRALGTMAGGVAHNFNNLLSAVLGHAELLEMQTTDPRIVYGLKAIEKASHDGAEMVRRLLEYTEPKRDALLDLVDLNDIVNDAVELTRPHWEQAGQAAGRPVQVVKQLGDEATVLGNGSELRQSLVNLIFNAIEAMPIGGGLTITTQRHGDEVILEVQDTGVGMDEFTRQHAVDPLFSTKGSVGVGWGLTQVNNAVERHRGRINITSARGQGTTVAIAVPFATNKPEPRPDAPPAQEASPARILIVEDDPIVRDVLEAMLTNIGHTVVACEDGPSAIAVLERESFDLACVDLSMPRMGGWELIDIIKQRWPHVPTVLITGWLEAVRSTPRHSLVDGVVLKPFGYRQLRGTISALLERARNR